jgi:Flagellin and related hook-associated proteins
MASINTNYGAMIAAQAFAATSRELDRVQNRVTTGLKVIGPKDNGAIWAIATTQKANAKALDATINSLQRQQSIADVGLAAGETIMSALTELKSLATAIAQGGSTTAYQRDYNALVTEISSAVTAAVFDGTNALTTPAYTLNSAGAATAANVQTAMDAWASALQTVGTTAKSLERQVVFNTKLQDALEAGAGNLVDADMAKESAKLQALQTKQQLGIQALSIANQSASVLLSLFR